MKNQFIKNRCLAGAWMVAAMVLSASAAHAQSAVAGGIKYANNCAGCHGAAPPPPPGFAIRPSVHKASANAPAIPHVLQGDADIAAFVPPGRPEIVRPSPPSAADLTANSAKLLIRSQYTTVITSYTVSCTGGGAPKTATAPPTPGVYYTAITVTGLTPSTLYNCSGTATNSSGTSLASASPVSITTAGPPAPLPTPIVKIRLLNSGQAGTEVQCPVQYSSSNPPSWFIKASAHLPRGSHASAIMSGAKFRYMFKVNGYPPPGHSSGVWYPSPGVSFVPLARGTYTFEVIAQAFHNEEPISRYASSEIISCKLQ